MKFVYPMTLERAYLTCDFEIRGVIHESPSRSLPESSFQREACSDPENPLPDNSEITTMRCFS